MVSSKIYCACVFIIYVGIVAGKNIQNETKGIVLTEPRFSSELRSNYFNKSEVESFKKRTKWNFNCRLTDTVHKIIRYIDINSALFSHNSSLIQSLIASNVVLHCHGGVYHIDNNIQIHDVENFQIIGDVGTIFTSSQNKIIELSGTLKNVVLRGIKFSSIKKSTLNDPEGLVTIANYGVHDTMDNIVIEKCRFTNRNTQANGIKVISEGARSMINHLNIVDNVFAHIGRMGIELQNHLYKPVQLRYKNYLIARNLFNDVGTIQTGPAPSCISVSGYALNGEISNNEIKDMHMNTSKNVYYGIENAGTVGLLIKGNYIHTIGYGFTGILGSGPSITESLSRGQPLKSNWIIERNIISLKGSVPDKTKIRGMDISYSNNYNINNNIIITDGIGMKLTDCLRGEIVKNKILVKNGNALYLQGICCGNRIYHNQLDCEQTLKQGVVMFKGIQTCNNKAFDNKIPKIDNHPKWYVNFEGARDNF